MQKEEKSSFDKFSLDGLRELKGFKRKDLTIASKETVNLTSESKDFKDYFKLVKVDDIDIVKELVGVSDRVASRKDCGCSKISKIPSIKDLEVKDKDLRNKNLAAARIMANQYIYGNSAAVKAHKPVLNKFLEVSRARIPLFFFNDIIVHDKATLHVANDVLNVSARKIKLYGSGKITYTGPTTFNCRSFEGNL